MIINITIVYIPGDLFALSFLDVARYLKYLLVANNVSPRQVLISKNRLHLGAVNIVLGAHKMPNPERYKNYCCIFLNLEQLGPKGKAVPPEYLAILKTNYVIDYHQKNVIFYRSQEAIAEVPLLVFGYAPYLSNNLKNEGLLGLSTVNREVTFMGSINMERRYILKQIADRNISIRVIEMVFGPEKDLLLSTSEALVNIPFYNTGILEQVRAFQALSVGTPVISIYNDEKPVYLPKTYQDNIFWLKRHEIGDFFEHYYLTNDYLCERNNKLSGFRSDDSSIDNAAAIEFIHSIWLRLNTRIADSPNQAIGCEFNINIGSGKDYKPGWLNIDVSERLLPDICMDLSVRLELPTSIGTDSYGLVCLNECCSSYLYADNVLEHVTDLPVFMENCLRLLKVGGEMVAIVPYEGSKGAWQDPTHVRAMNENSWKYYTDWAWYLGWFEHRFSLKKLELLDQRMNAVAVDQRPSFMRVALVKKRLTAREKSLFRSQMPDWGPIPDVY